MITLKIGITPLFKEHISQLQSLLFPSGDVSMSSTSFLNVSKPTHATPTYELIPKFATNRLEHNQIVTTTNTIQSRKNT